MRMYNGERVRQACLASIRQCAQTEQKTQQALATAARDMQEARANAEQKYTQLRQEAEALLSEVCTLARQGNKLLADLKLTPAPSSPASSPSNSGLRDLQRLMRNCRSETRQILARLKVMAGKLEVERRKWWKFW